jgi:hypothetical protein
MQKKVKESLNQLFVKQDFQKIILNIHSRMSISGSADVIFRLKHNFLLNVIVCMKRTCHSCSCAVIVYQQAF